MSSDKFYWDFSRSNKNDEIGFEFNGQTIYDFTYDPTGRLPFKDFTEAANYYGRDNIEKYMSMVDDILSRRNVVEDVDNLKKALQDYDENGKFAKFGIWEVHKGGYDLWWEVCKEGTPVIGCIASGEIENGVELGNLERLSSISLKERDAIIDVIANEYNNLQKTVQLSPNEPPPVKEQARNNAQFNEAPVDNLAKLAESGDWQWHMNDKGEFDGFHVYFGHSMFTGSIDYTVKHPYDGPSAKTKSIDVSVEFDIFPAPVDVEEHIGSMVNYPYRKISDIIVNNIPEEGKDHSFAMFNFYSSGGFNTADFKKEFTDILVLKDLIDPSKSAEYEEIKESGTGFYYMAEQQRNIENNLIESGDWHIDEKDFIRFQHANTLDDVQYMGTVNFGHLSFDIIGSGDNDKFELDIEEYIPPYFKEISGDFKFSEDLKSLLTEAPEYSRTVYLERNMDNIGSIEDFKQSVVECLIKNDIIQAYGTTASMFNNLKETGQAYSQQYDKQLKKVLHNLSQKPKLSPEEIKDLTAFYDRPNYYKIPEEDHVRGIVKEMIMDGFSDQRIKTFALVKDDQVGSKMTSQHVNKILEEPFIKDLKETVKNHSKNNNKRR